MYIITWKTALWYLQRFTTSYAVIAAKAVADIVRMVSKKVNLLAL